MKSNFITTLEELAGGDRSLRQIVENNSKHTQEALEAGARENEKMKLYLEMQNQITATAERSLAESRNAFQRFKAALKNPSSGRFKGLASSMTFGLYKPTLSPGRLADIILDLYNSQVEHLNAVRINHDLLKNRRKLVYGIAKDAAESIRDHSLSYASLESQVKRIESLGNLIVEALESGKPKSDDIRDGLVHLKESGIYDPGRFLAALDSGKDMNPELYVMKNDLDLILSETKDKYRGDGLEVKGGITLLQGLDLQKEQFDATIEAMALQVNELEVDLKYTKHIAQNTFYLLKAQDASKSAIDSFISYKAAMNNLQTFNSLGARVMLDRVGFLMTSPFFEPGKIEDAKKELREGLAIFYEKEKVFHENVSRLVRNLDIKEVPQ